MAGEIAEEDDADGQGRRRPRRIVRRAALLILLAFLAAVLLVWFQRYRIADNLLSDQLAASGVEASYTIEAIGPERQILTNIVIGDPQRPDLTIERLEIRIRARFGLPAIRSVRVIEPRLFGSFQGGQLSFGSLDPLLFGEGKEESFTLPDLMVAIEDGRGLVESDYGPIGLRIAGEGHLRDGFEAELAATAPSLEAGDCAIQGATLYGMATITAGRPNFTGPLRFASMACPGETSGGMALDGGAAQLTLRGDADLTGVDGKATLSLGAARFADSRAARLSGDSEFTWRNEALTTRYSIEASDLHHPQVSATMLALEGFVRARRGFERFEIEGSLEGSGVNPGAALDSQLASAAASGANTLLAPLLSQLRRQLASETRSSTLTAQYAARVDEGRLSLNIPQARLRGSSDAVLLLVSRAQFASGGDALGGAAAQEQGAPIFSGNFVTGGPGLPRISGRISNSAEDGARLSLAMAEYAAGDARLAIPELVATQGAGGPITFAGELIASGAIPGGSARELIVPVSGGWSPAAGLSLWRECTDIRFAELALSNLGFGRHRLRLCPPSGSAILRADDAGLRIAAGLTALDLKGRLGETPVAIASGPVGLAWPGVVTARNLAIALGPPEMPTRFAVTDLTARLDGEVGGEFSGADVFLDAVPLDVLAASGRWTYDSGRLALSDGTFRLEDRAEPSRFRPLVARGATLALVNNVISAEAAMREPGSDRLVGTASIRHDLGSGAGFADLSVPGLKFDREMQPTDLTRYALGVVANVEGVVTGSGRIDWDAENITSSGRFSTESLDLAAAFGPVSGASGTLIFTDLLGLTTAPAQRIAIEAVNPGIEVRDGAVLVQLRGGSFLDLQAASFPFFGGRVTMRPLTIAIGESEERSYILEITGLEAARFVERMELGNLAATGTFDGTIPIIFDARGNGRLEGGQLISRAPGGNISYVGQLTYEDLSPMANFAFDALRSLDYREMRVTLEGPLTGELATRVAFEGIRQGAETEKNFITRQLARLPLRLLINIRAPFYRLMTSMRSLYDTSAVRDPRDLGLLAGDGGVIQRETDQDAVDERDAAREAEEAARIAAEAGTDPEPDIQPAESETMP